MSVSHRARRHEDRGGDPLDGLVNLFDLGIVLAVAFLLAALSSVNLTEVLTDQEAAAAAQQAVTAAEDEVVNELEVAPGERVVGEGQEVGTVYRLEDGRTVIVRPEDAEAVPGEGESLLPAEPDATPESEPDTATPDTESGEIPDVP